MGPFNFSLALQSVSEFSVADRVQMQVVNQMEMANRTIQAAMVRTMVGHAALAPLAMIAGAPTIATTYVIGSASAAATMYALSAAKTARRLRRMVQKCERSEDYRLAAAIQAMRVDVLFTLPHGRGRALAALFDAVRLAALAEANELGVRIAQIGKVAIVAQPLVARASVQRAFVRTAEQIGRISDARRRAAGRLVLSQLCELSKLGANARLKLDAARDYIEIAAKLGSDSLDPGVDTLVLFVHQSHVDDSSYVTIALRQAAELMEQGLGELYRRCGASEADAAVRVLAQTEPPRFVLDVYSKVLYEQHDLRWPAYSTLMRNTSDHELASVLAVIGGQRMLAPGTEPGRSL
ncbi:MAG: hypothetical protein ACOYN3_05815 [Acidimicrobiia bacterium]